MPFSSLFVLHSGCTARCLSTRLIWKRLVLFQDDAGILKHKQFDTRSQSCFLAFCQSTCLQKETVFFAIVHVNSQLNFTFTGIIDTVDHTRFQSTDPLNGQAEVPVLTEREGFSKSKIVVDMSRVFLTHPLIIPVCLQVVQILLGGNGFCDSDDEIQTAKDASKDGNASFGGTDGEYKAYKAYCKNAINWVICGVYTFAIKKGV